MGISEKDYVAWVQRTLNRELDSVLITDGVITDEYREAVETFQLVHDLAVTGQVGVNDQNTMVRVNHDERSYVYWLQESLRSSGVAPELAITGVIDRKTTDCIKAFQSYHNLSDDGWVGAKTELELIQAGGLMPGGHVPRVGPVPESPRPSIRRPRPLVLPIEKQVNRAISNAYYDAFYNRGLYSGDDRRVRLCVLGKLKQRHGIKDRFPANLSFAYHGSAQYSTVESLFVSAREFLTQHLQRMPLEHRSGATENRKLISDLIAAIRTGLRDVEMYDTQMRPSAHSSFRPLLNEVKEIIRSQKKQPNSILSCFR